ncbi:MAG: hypothetical protein KC483_03405 [Nitrosarchaeum sp.]|nr:hypothetical protein [Nitrosarchaeum sp.]
MNPKKIQFDARKVPLILLEPNVIHFFQSAPVPEILTDSTGKTSTFVGLYTGQFEHMGMEFEITPEDLSNMIRNFRDDVLRKRLPIDFSHREDEKAAGWIVDLQLSENGENLMITAEWTPSGLEALQTKEFRYFSADFWLQYTDPNTKLELGKTLRGGALTNIPFLQLPEIKLSRKPKPIKGDELMPNETISLSEHNMALKIKNDEISDLKDQVAKLSEEKKKVKDLDEKVIQLHKQIKTMEEEAKEKDKEAQFDELVREGKLVLAQKDAFMKNDVVALAKLAEKANITNATPNAQDPNAQKFSDDDREYMERHGLNEAQYKRITEGKARSVMAPVAD